MPSSFYSQRNGEYVYDVSVTKDETVRLCHRYRARLSNAERIEDGRLMYVEVPVQDTYGPTVTEAMRALDASFETWRETHRPTREICERCRQLAVDVVAMQGRMHYHCTRCRRSWNVPNQKPRSKLST